MRLYVTNASVHIRVLKRYAARKYHSNCVKALKIAFSEYCFCTIVILHLISCIQLPNKLLILIRKIMQLAMQIIIRKVSMFHTNVNYQTNLQ